MSEQERLVVCFSDPAKFMVYVKVNDYDGKVARQNLVHELLESEDAKRLALAKAVELGWREPSIREQSIYYGDPENPAVPYVPGKPGHEKCEPFLAVRVYSPAMYDIQPVGDSLM